MPDPGGARFFSSDRAFDGLDGTVFRSTEQAARAARDRFRALAGSVAGGSARRDTAAG